MIFDFLIISNNDYDNYCWCGLYINVIIICFVVINVIFEGFFRLSDGLEIILCVYMNLNNIVIFLKGL